MTPTRISLICGRYICGGLRENLTTQRQIRITERYPANTVPVNVFLNLCIYFQMLQNLGVWGVLA
uniref:Uncharacterized protein n=1 Tax=Geospiza parvula TaxID=87175 RepID=A0A8C3M5W6_GEOPR